MSLPVDKALRKATSHIKAGELVAAEEIYKQILSKFPKNKKAIQGYHKLKAGITSKGLSNFEPPQEQVQELINLYNPGHHEKALKKVKSLISLFPKAITLHNIQGASNAALQRYDAAIDSYNQALKIKPDYAKVKHLVASLTGETTKAAPREYVEDLFDQYAAKFEHSLIENLQYQTPKIITEMIIKRHPSKALGSVLDLGCGTGLAGLELKQFCEKLYGIDLSNSMLEQARTKDVYDKLIHDDIAEYLAEADLDFDYFISTDVFIYVGELSDVFRLIKSRNSKIGKLVFSTEHREGEGFYLEKSGRYSHSKNYIEGLCIKYGYHLSHFEKTKLRKEKSEFLMGGLYLLDFDPAETTG